MNELALFAGAGGGILGGQLLGWRTVCAVENNVYPASVLAQRQNDGLLESFPIWDDVRTFDGRPWNGVVDVVSGGFPCQDISCAGKGKGISGERSGLWSEMARIISEVRPRFVFVENSPMLTIRGIHRVLGDLAEMGFDAKWGVISAASVGAPHKRERIWIVANTNMLGKSNGRRKVQEANGEVPQRNDNAKFSNTSKYTRKMANTHCDGRATRRSHDQKHDRPELDTNGKHIGNVADPISQGLPRRIEQRRIRKKKEEEQQRIKSFRRNAAPGSKQWEIEPDVGRVAHGVAARVDRITAIGNGQVPQCAAEAWRILTS